MKDERRRMDTEKRLAKRVDFLRKSIYISYRNMYEAMNTLSCKSLYETINNRFNAHLSETSIMIGE